MIRLKVNGKQVELERATPLLAYIEKLGVDPRAVAVEHNGTILQRAAYESITLNHGDTVEIVRMVGGGRESFAACGGTRYFGGPCIAAGAGTRAISRASDQRIASRSLIAASASALSSHGSAPEAILMVRSWPLPASSTQSPGRARSIARRIAARRSMTIS